MTSSNQHVLTTEISRLRDAIKKKYRLMRHGEADIELTLNKQYSPILKELSKIPTTPFVPLKQEEAPSVKLQPPDTPPPVSFMDTDVIAETPDDPPNVADVLSTPQGRRESLEWIERSFKHPLTARYLLKMIKDSKRNIDHTYGPRIENDGIMVGDKPLQFSDNGEIIIDNVHYKGTVGLYELLFKRIPKDGTYTEGDLDAYKDICIQTNAHRRKYNPRGQINRIPRSDKYKRIIMLLFPPKSITGKGYSYWDNPNELCDRLRLLLASQDAGHTGHANEIASIIEELREAGFIKGSGNRKIRSLIK